MPTIRDLVATLRRFDGVQAAAVLGRDGLLIDNEADAGLDGDATIARMQEVCAGSASNVLAASLRSPDDITGLRLAGVPYFTAAPDVLDRLLAHEVSDSSAAEFDAAMVRLGA